MTDGSSPAVPQVAPSMVARGWPRLRFGGGLLCLHAVSMVLCLWAFATLPQLVGWRSVAVMSGSMSPAVRAGDVVVTRPDIEGHLKPGAVILFPDPAAPGWLLHRVEAVEEDGRIVTKGDANRREDSGRIDAASVAGVGAGLVPLAGLPALWWSNGQRLPLLIALGVFAGLLLGCRYGLLARFDPWLLPEGAAPDDGPRATPGDSRPPAELAYATS